MVLVDNRHVTSSELCGFLGHIWEWWMVDGLYQEVIQGVWRHLVARYWCTGGQGTCARRQAETRQADMVSLAGRAQRPYYNGELLYAKLECHTDTARARCKTTRPLGPREDRIVSGRI